MPTTWPSRSTQRPARVARVDRGVDLDQAADRPVGVGHLERPVEPGHDARAERAHEAERVADDVGLAADVHRARVAERGGRGLGRRLVGGEHGDVGRGVAARDRRAGRGPVGERHLDARRLVDDVERGEDLARCW